MHVQKGVVFLFMAIGLILGACQSQSYADFREKGRAKTRSLIAELKTIRTKDQLIERQKELEKSFSSLRMLVEQVRQYQELHPDAIPPALTLEDKEQSDQLRLEILRLYRLDGGKAILDQCRREN